jgi:hypothetical protein
MDISARLEDHYVKFECRDASVSVRLLRPYALSLLILLTALLDACGGGSGGDSGGGPTSAGPTAEDMILASSAALRGTLDLSKNRVTLVWWDTFPAASRYQIEQQDASGAWVVIDGMLALRGGELGASVKWTGPYPGPATWRVEAVLHGYTVPLLLSGDLTSTSLTLAPPAQMPSIVLDQQEPLEGPIDVSIANGSTAWFSVSYGIDSGTYGFSGPDQHYARTLPTGDITTGTHLLSASIESSASSKLVIGRRVQIHTSAAALSVSGVQAPDVFDAYAVATSDSSINSVVAGISDAATVSQTLTMPNACVPQPCVAGQSFNAYHFSFNTKGLGPGFHSIDVQATDNAGNTAAGGESFNLPAPTTATLDFPADGAVVAGTLHLAGTFFSGAPGALELLVTLSGTAIYDTTVANTGAVVPYSADVSLVGVSPGNHTVGVYARVGNTTYTAGSTALIRVSASP